MVKHVAVMIKPKTREAESPSLLQAIFISGENGGSLSRNGCLDAPAF